MGLVFTFYGHGLERQLTLNRYERERGDGCVAVGRYMKATKCSKVIQNQGVRCNLCFKENPFEYVGESLFSVGFFWK